MYPNWINEILVCPETKEKLIHNISCYQRRDGNFYSFIDNILSIVYPKDLSGDDAKYNKLYNFLAPLYDLNERIGGKLFFGINMTEGRKQIISLLGLKPGMCILEVSPGSGVFQNYLRHEITDTGELVALDLSMGMLRQCQKRNNKLNVHLIHGNAQFLPFVDHSFDALFHFGGVNLFNDPNKAISEFVRVVKKDGIVSWGDEGISQTYPHKLRRKIALKINPGFSKPRPDLPDSVYDVKENEVYDGLAYLVVAKKK